MKKPNLKSPGVVPSILFVGLFAFVGLKGCIVTAWTPPKEPQAFVIVGGDKREMSFTFYPDRRALVTYGDPTEGSFEAVLLRLRGGEYGTHYFGPIWNVSRGAESLLGLRWISGGAEPVRFGCEVVNKLKVGYGDSAFSPTGSNHESIYYFRRNAFKYSGMWLTSVEYDAETFDPIRRALEKP